MSIKVTQAMVLAAGRGTRMAPLTDHMPKPLITVAGRALVDRAIDHLQEAGVRRVVVNSSYMAHMLESHLSHRLAPSILFSREQTLLETGGGIAQALAHFGNSPFFVVNGDVIWVDGRVPALQRLAENWHEGLDALLLVHPHETAIGFDGPGDFHVSATGVISRRKAQEHAPYIYTGVQLLHPRLFANCPQGAFSLNVLYNRAMALEPPRIAALIHDGDWLHVGDVAGREQAENYMRSRPT